MLEVSLDCLLSFCNSLIVQYRSFIMLVLFNYRCPIRQQNYEYIQYLITALYFESWVRIVRMFTFALLIVSSLINT